jgi:3-dehydroquinate dehydratase-1
MIKICVSITGSNMEEIKSQLDKLALLDIDMIEWRADYYFSFEALELIKRILPDKQLIFTFRTESEGGKTQPDDEFLMNLLALISDSGKVDFIDVELEGICKTKPYIIEQLKLSGIKLIISNHNFENTPSEEEIINKFKRMAELGADMAKIAVMPQNRGDVETLISAAKVAGKLIGIPIVAISMGELGENTRIDGEKFGSIITFGSLDKESAPGQIQVEELIKILRVK